MQYSPYAPPQPTRGVGYSEHGDFRPVGWTTTGTTIAIFASLALGMVMSGFSLAYPRPNPNELGIVMMMGLLALLLQAVNIAADVFFLIWMHRASKNAHAFGHDCLEFTPGWCVGWWFIPVAWWWMPYRALREIWRASDPEAIGVGGPSAWIHRPVPSSFLLWWLSWQLAAIPALAGAALSTMTTLGYGGDSTMSTAILMAITHDLTIVAAVMIVTIMRQLDRRQQICWEKISSTSSV